MGIEMTDWYLHVDPYIATFGHHNIQEYGMV